MKKKGQALPIGALLLLIVGMSVAGMISMFTNVLNGKIYQQMEDDIDSISNATVRESVKASAIATFEGTQQLAELQPILALAFATVLVIVAIVGVLSVTQAVGVGGGRGGAVF